jgi:hypothetical protein
MQHTQAVRTRNRAIFGIRAWTVTAILGSLGLTWLFAQLAEDFFSGKTVAQQPVPNVPQQQAPVQQAPQVIQKVIHKAGTAPIVIGTAPRPPASGPAAGPAPAPAPAPAPPPPCHSTPSKPC